MIFYDKCENRCGDSFRFFVQTPFTTINAVVYSTATVHYENITDENNLKPLSCYLV